MPRIPRALLQLAARLPVLTTTPASQRPASLHAFRSFAPPTRHFSPITSLLRPSIWSSASTFGAPLGCNSLGSVLQTRSAAMGAEYQPSQRKRKRKHGFLARKRSVSGRKILARRKAKQRRFLSH